MNSAIQNLITPYTGSDPCGPYGIAKKVKIARLNTFFKKNESSQVKEFWQSAAAFKGVIWGGFLLDGNENVLSEFELLPKGRGRRRSTVFIAQDVITDIGKTVRVTQTKDQNINIDVPYVCSCDK